jgi:hypothetical protein
VQVSLDARRRAVAAVSGLAGGACPDWRSGARDARGVNPAHPPVPRHPSVRRHLQCRGDRPQRARATPNLRRRLCRYDSGPLLMQVSGTFIKFIKFINFIKFAGCVHTGE